MIFHSVAWSYRDNRNKIVVTKTHLTLRKNATLCGKFLPTDSIIVTQGMGVCEKCESARKKLRNKELKVRQVLHQSGDL